MSGVHSTICITCGILAGCRYHSMWKFWQNVKSAVVDSSSMEDRAIPIKDDLFNNLDPEEINRIF